MRTAYFMIIHYTYGWTQRCLRTFNEHFPEQEMFVFNNNPRQDQTVRKTRGERGENQTWQELCSVETTYADNHAKLLELPAKEQGQNIYQLPTHGDVLDYIFKWAKNEGCEYLWHLEPDCKIMGTQWHINMWNARSAVTGLGQMFNEGPYAMCICPTLWHVESVLNLNMSFNKVKPDINTGQSILRKFQSQGKARVVQAQDFIHYSGGTKRCPFMML